MQVPMLWFRFLIPLALSSSPVLGTANLAQLPHLYPGDCKSSLLQSPRHTSWVAAEADLPFRGTGRSRKPPLIGVSSIVLEAALAPFALEVLVVITLGSFIYLRVCKQEVCLSGFRGALGSPRCHVA